MAQGTRFRLDGAYRLRESLLDCGEELTEWKKTNKAAADVVKPVSKAKAPKRTGAMSRTTRTSATAKAGVVRVGNKKAPYAGPIHFGWPAKGIKANPFATDAAQVTEPAWTQVYKNRVDEALGKVKGI